MLNKKAVLLDGLVISVGALIFSAAPAQAILITSSFGGDVIDFSEFPSQFTAGPEQIGTSLNRDITWSSTFDSSVFAFTGNYSLLSNGFWNNGRGGYVGLNNGNGSMTFTFNDSPVSSVGGLINYALSGGSPIGSNPVIEALGSGGTVLESIDLFSVAPIVTNGNNLGAFRGFSRPTADIEAFRVSNAFIVLDDFEFAGEPENVPVPEPSSTILGSLVAIGIGATVKRKLSSTAKSSKGDRKS